MPEPITTISISHETKRELALLKGDRSWDELLRDMVAHYPRDEAIEEAEKRLAELRSGAAKTVPWAEIKKRRKNIG